MDETLLDIQYSTKYLKAHPQSAMSRSLVGRFIRLQLLIDRQERERKRERERERVCKFRAGPCMYHRDTRRLRRDSLSRILVSQSFSDCILPLVVPPLARAAADKRLLSIHFEPASQREVAVLRRDMYVSTRNKHLSDF